MSIANEEGTRISESDQKPTVRANRYKLGSVNGGAANTNTGEIVITSRNRGSADKQEWCGVIRRRYQGKWAKVVVQQRSENSDAAALAHCGNRKRDRLCPVDGDFGSYPSETHSHDT